MVNRIYTPDDKRLPRELKRIASSLRDVQRPTGTERELSLQALQAAQAELAAQQAALEAAVAAIPVAIASQVVGGGFSPSGSWAQVASLSIPRPTGKTVASVMALANIALNWTVPGGAAWPVVSVRVLLNGAAGPAVPLGQGVSDAGSGVSGRMAGTAMHAGSAGGSGAVTVAVQAAITGWIGSGAQGQATFSGGQPQLAANVVFSS